MAYPCPVIHVDISVDAPNFRPLYPPNNIIIHRRAAFGAVGRLIKTVIPPAIFFRLLVCGALFHIFE